METVYTKMEVDLTDLIEKDVLDDDTQSEDAVPKKKRKSTISLKKKLQLLQDVDNGMTLAEVSDRYKICRTTAYKTIKDKPLLLKMMQANPTNLALTKLRQPTYQSLDEAMTLYVQQCQANDVEFTGPILLEKASKFAKALGYTEFRGSSGWLSNFRKRHGFLSRNNVEGQDSKDMMEKFWREQVFTPLLQKYPAKDIFFTDETGLFFCTQPGNSLTLKHEKCVDGSNSSTRMTLLLSCNMDGSEKLKPLVVGKFGRPKCLKSKEN
jgi:Tc5 transposase DNA-binding domain/DDE superfamily endonuclease